MKYHKFRKKNGKTYVCGLPDCKICGDDNYTKLLLHCDGADGALSFLDETPSEFDWMYNRFLERK